MSLLDLMQHGASSAFLFIPMAVLLGALHGLEPGHSKTMMAAFIIAVRGTVGQAVLLGVSATVSHTLVVWVVALGGMYVGSGWTADAIDPYVNLASAALIIGVAAWMLWRTWREQRRISRERFHAAHPHGAEMRRIDTGHGLLTLEIFEGGVPPRWRVRVESGHWWPAHAVKVETRRPQEEDVQVFAFADRGGYLESIDEIAEPHEFTARLRLFHGSHAHDYDVAFRERAHGHGHAHPHDHGHEDEHVHGHGHAHEATGLDVLDGGQHDTHELAHANDIRRRFEGGANVTDGQIVLFGLTGGLIPCPAAITVLLLCLQVKKFTLGVALVLAFSVGLGVTMVSAGVIASLGMRQVSRRWLGFGAFARRAPYFSSMVMICIGLVVGAQALMSFRKGYRHHHTITWPFSGKL